MWRSAGTVPVSIGTIPGRSRIMTDSVATRFLGGSPLTVLVRLVVVSLLVGALMSWLGVDALDLLDDLQRGLVHLYGTGFAALNDLGRTALAGAAVVIPVWLVLRLLSYRGPNPRAGRGAGPGLNPLSRWSNPGRAGDERRP